MKKDHFADQHPLVSFLFFGAVLLFATMLAHPAARAISLVTALAYTLQTEGKKKLRFVLCYCLPMLLLTAVINPAFNHEGVTILCYLPRGNPLTLESILCGVSNGCMLVTVMLWFVCFNRVVTSDKFVYLFGRVVPSLSLLLSMTLRFVPRFTAHLRTTAQLQKALGRDVQDGSLWQRTRAAVTVLSITVTWAMENAIETSDSMKSRGYGLKGRTAFSIYLLDERQRLLLLWLGFCIFCITMGVLASAFSFRFFPGIRGALLSRENLFFYLIYAALCFTPVLLNIGEERRWRSIRLTM